MSSILLLALPLGGFVLLAVGGAYLLLRLRRLERIEDEHFRYVDGRVDELAEALYSKLAAVDRRFDAADDRMNRAEAAAHVDHLLHLTAAAASRGEVGEVEAAALERQLLRWRDEARAAAPDRAPS
ncbi:MAG: hypothetical protein AAGF23_15285 [Acidobacteriota bacterium]